jgi:hypothetical protein
MTQINADEEQGPQIPTQLFLMRFQAGINVFSDFIEFARAHGMWTYEPRQGRNAATAVCSASAVVTLAFFFK